MSYNVYKIGCFGDSTADAEFYWEECPKEHAYLKPYTTWLSEKLPKLFKREVEVINSGISGDTTENAKIQFQKDVLDHRPDMMIVQFGANDQRIQQDLGLQQSMATPDAYAYNLLFFNNASRQLSAIPILMTPDMLLWTDGYKSKYLKSSYKPNKKHGFNGNITTYVQRILAIAAVEQIRLVDINEKELEYDLVQQNALKQLMPDFVHPNKKGHRFIADAILENFKNIEL